MTSMTASGRLLTEDDPIEAWDAVAAPQGMTGIELRDKIRRADEIMDGLIREDIALAVWNGLPKGTWS